LQGIDIASAWEVRQIWVVVLAGNFFYWVRKRKFSEENFVVSIISFYLLWMISYGWVAEQSFLDPLPFIFVLILAYRPKKIYIFLVGGINFLIYVYSFANHNLFLFVPFLEIVSPSLIVDIENLYFSSDLGPILWTVRGTMGLVVSLSLIVFLAIILKPELLEILQERVQDLKDMILKRKK